MRASMITGDMSASGFYRCLFPAGELVKHGHEFKLWPHRQENKQIGQAKEVFIFDMDASREGLDLIVIHQKLDDFWMRFKKENDTFALAYDSDDWMLGLPTHNAAFHGTHPKTAIVPGVNRYNLPKILRLMDVVTTSTPFLADRFQKMSRNVKVIRNRLHWPMWEHAKVQPSERVRVGWYGSIAWRTGDLDVLRDIIPRILKRNPHIDFVAGGDARQIHDHIGVPEDRRISYGRIDFLREHMKLHEIVAVMDIGLVPMVDHPFNEAKSHLKGMEYNACGIPYVASNTESYRYYTQPGVNGFIAKNAKQWMSRIEELANDDRLRAEMSLQARETAKRHKLEDHWREWEDAYKSVL